MAKEQFAWFIRLNQPRRPPLRAHLLEGETKEARSGESLCGRVQADEWGPNQSDSKCLRCRDRYIALTKPGAK